VKAVSVNPTDCKRRATAPLPNGAEHWVLGFDVAGVVVAVGEQCTLFKPADEVFYAGDARRSASYAQRQLVDERIVGPKPKCLDFARSAALPLTAITAWEGLFHCIDINRPGAGGVGLIAVQLARQLTQLAVLATASRPRTREWLSQLGAHHVIDHSAPMALQIKALDLGQPGLVFSTNESTHHLPDIARLIAPPSAKLRLPK
jgi:NADPH2:quinone reductase